MINEEKTFQDCLYGHYDSPIYGEEKKDSDESQRERHRLLYNVFKNHKWFTVSDVKRHVKHDDEFKTTEEVLEDAQNHLFGREASLSELSNLAWQLMSEITPDSRGLKVLYTV